MRPGSNAVGVSPAERAPFRSIGGLEAFMLLRIVCYHQTGGGGLLRFVIEMTAALGRVRPEARIEFISHGTALDTYAAAWRSGAHDPGAQPTFRDFKPRAYWRTAPRRFWRLPGSRLVAEAGAGSLLRWGFEVPESLHEGCDVVWLPILHNHRVGGGGTARAVATFHGTMNLQPDISGLLAPARRAEMRLTEAALNSEMKIITGAHATVGALVDLLGARARRMQVIPNAAVATAGLDQHAPAVLPPWPWIEQPFVLYPAALHVHKNHALLLRAWAQHCFPGRLVLTGVHSDWPRHLPLARKLRRLATDLGLKFGEDIIGLGYISDAIYYELLRRAHALVMPTLGEGGESFPVEEALAVGVPVLCSDIPPLREQVERIGGNVLWFDPRQPRQLAMHLEALRDDYAAIKQASLRAAGCLRARGWADAAQDYWRIFDASHE